MLNYLQSGVFALTFALIMHVNNIEPDRFICSFQQVSSFDITVAACESMPVSVAI